MLFNGSVVSHSLLPLRLQHARLPCPSLSLGIHPNPCPSSWWCHPTISSSVIPFSSHLQSFPASGSFPVSQLFPLGGQSAGASASASVLPMTIQGWFSLGWTGCILQSKGLSRVFFSTTVRKHQFFGVQLSFMVQLSHPYMTTGKTIVLTLWTFVGKERSLLFNMLSEFVIAFLLRSKCFLIWASAFQFHGYSHSLQWFWSPRKENLSLLPLFSFLFAMKWWYHMPWS